MNELNRILEIKKNVPLQKEQLLGGLALLVSRYREEGFLEARLDSLVWPKQGSGGTVHIYFTEGERFLVQSLEIFGAKRFSLHQIRRWFRTGAGTPFRPGRLEADIRNLLQQYARIGYLLANVQVKKLTLDHRNNRVLVCLKISEGGPVKIHHVQIHGLETTHERVIVRELNLKPGAPLTWSKLQRVPERFRRLPFVEMVTPPEVTFTEDSLAVVTIPVHEGNSSRFNGVLGYNPKQGGQAGYVSGHIDVQFGNILGSGRSLRTFWEKRGPISQSLQLSYQEPWLLGWPVNGEFGFSQNVQDTSFVRRIWRLGFRAYLLENISVGITIGQERVIPDSIGRERFDLRRSKANRLYLEVGFDSRNHPWNPTEGLMYSTSVDFVRKTIHPEGSGAAGKTQDFQRMALDLEYLQPLFRRQVMMLGLHGRQVRIGDEPVPVDELYRLGGARNLRGYRDDQFLGSRIAWLTLEYRLIPETNSRIALFLDSAYIGRRTKDKHWRQSFQFGYGIGLRTQTSLGVVGFDYGLGKGDSFSRGKIHVRLINNF